MLHSFLLIFKPRGHLGPGFSTQASFFDYDGDGDLDVYVMNYPGEWDARLVVMQKEGLEIPFRFRDHLFRNDGKAGFVEVGLEAGINNLAFGLGLITADFNEDGWTDIYVANDYLEADYLYINQKDGTFVESMKSFCNHNSQ